MMTYIKKAPNVGIKKINKTKKHEKNTKSAKMPRISTIKAKTSSRREFVKGLNKLYSQLLAEHKDKSEHLISELLKLIGDHYRLLIRQKHSTRILQACLKYGTDEQRQYIYQKIKDEIPYLCMTNHGSHLAIKAYRYCNADAKKHFEDNIIFSAASLSYLKSRYGSLIWDFIYNKFSMAKQIGSLLQLLVPTSVKVLKPDLFDILLKTKNLNQLHAKIACDQELFPKYKEICVGLFGKLIDRHLTNTSISHDIGYLTCLLASDDEMDDLAQRFTQGLDSLYITKSGVFVACHLYGYTPPKQRKTIVKQLKQNLEEMATNVATNLFVSRVLLVTDDTKLTIEHLVKPLGEITSKLAFDKYGHKIIVSLANKEALTLYNGYEREVIRLPSPRSLKEFELRHSQLSEAFRTLLLNVLSQNQHQIDVWLKDKYSSLVIESALSKFNLDLFNTISGAINDKFDGSLGLLDNSTCLHLVQRIIKKLPSDVRETACDNIWNVISPRIDQILMSRSVFLLVSILETVDRSSPVFSSATNLICHDDILKAKSKNSSNCGLNILEKILFNTQT